VKDRVEMAPVYPRPFGAPAPRHPQQFAGDFVAEPPKRTQLAGRRYDVLYLDDAGQIQDANIMAPALPGFEASCGAFAHGTLILTSEGPVAVEDLLPGMAVETRDKGPQQLMWVGSMMLVPNATAPGVEPATLTRVTDGSMGPGRPGRDLVFGPHARILRRNAACMSLFGTEAAFAPASAFTDGVSIIEVHPVSPVRVFHLLLDGQHVISANGVEVESFHPGRRDAIGVSDQLMPAFLSLFPHIKRLSDFGPMRVPRLSGEDIRALESN
jgi:hypothetical protein